MISSIGQARIVACTFPAAYRGGSSKELRESEEANKRGERPPIRTETNSGCDNTHAFKALPARAFAAQANPTRLLIEIVMIEIGCLPESLFAGDE